MSVPRLNRSLVLEAPVELADGSGGYVQDWQPLGVLWADVKAGTGRETSASSVTVSRVRYKITVRAAPYGVSSRPVAGQRFREGERVFHIQAVAEKGAGAQYLICHAEEEIAS